MEEKVNRLEALLLNAISQISTLTLERNNAKEADAATNARRIGAKASKKKGNKKDKTSKSTHNRTGRERPVDIGGKVTADASTCDACGSDRLSEVYWTSTQWP